MVLTVGVASSTGTGGPAQSAVMADPDPKKPIHEFLGIYTQCEGLAEDIG